MKVKIGKSEQLSSFMKHTVFCRRDRVVERDWERMIVDFVVLQRLVQESYKFTFLFYFNHTRLECCCVRQFVPQSYLVLTRLTFLQL